MHVSVGASLATRTLVLRWLVYIFPVSTREVGLALGIY